MTKIVTVMSMLLLLACSVYAHNNDNKKVIGEWQYEAPEAEYGYETGSIIIKKSDKGLSGYVKFEDGYKIDLKKVIFTGDTLKCFLYVDYEKIALELKIRKNTFEGFVNTPMGKLEVTGEKKK